MSNGIIRPILGTIVAVKVIDVLDQTLKRTIPKKRKKKSKRRRK